ncbi:tetratricopeptide repeat protein [Thalassotalea aquiviva]|uniref:tetratricopeptide repeat protein n=1 Tax=Thalassotalea aquiviva TaxID=3242415 RepID=UPI00352B00E8
MVDNNTSDSNPNTTDNSLPLTTLAKLHKGFALGAVIVEPDQGVVIRQNERFHLAPKAMEILLLMASADCQILSREELLQYGWGDKHASATNLTHIISEIRQVLNDKKSCPTFIQTIPRKGYRLMLPTIYKNAQGQFDIPLGTKEIDSPISKWSLTLSVFKSTRLFKASAAYVVFSWVLLQVVALVLPIFHAPDWILKFITLLLIIGFPVVICYQWLIALRSKQFKGRKNAQKKKFFYQQLAVDSFFVSLVLAVIYFLSTHLITFMEEENNRQSPTIATISNATLVENAIAVMGFNATMGEDIPEYLLSGLQEELISFLSREPNFKVTSLRATLALEESASLEKIRQRLGVRYILEGKAKMIKDTLHIDSKLIDTLTGFQVWTTSISGKKDQLLTVYNELSRRLLSSLTLLVGGQYSVEQQNLPTTDFDAYDSYLQGIAKRRSNSDLKSLKTAETLFKQAIEKDSSFSLATSALCQTYMEMYILDDNPATYKKGVDACELTAQIEQLSAESFISLGQLYRTSGQYSQALEHLNKALELNPKSPPIIRILAEVYYETGKYDKANELYQQAINIEPGYWENYYRYGLFLFFLGQFEDSMEQLNKVNLLNPKIAYAYNALGGAYFMMMDMEQASIAWSKALAIKPNAMIYSNLATSLFFSHQFEDAAKIYQQAVDLSPYDTLLLGNLGDAYKYTESGADKSRQAYKKALEMAIEREKINPNANDLKAQIGRYYSELKDCVSALSYKDSVLKKDNSDPYIFYELALLSLNCQEFGEAETFLQLALDNNYPKKLILADPQFIAYKDQLKQFYNVLISE